MFRNNHDDEENDFFDGPDLPDPVKEEKKPELKPDDPDYWDQEESEWEHLRPKNRSMTRIWIAGAVVILASLLLVWFRYFNPYVSDGTQFGYVEQIQERGHVFKTYEGVLLPYKDLMDTTRTYRQDFVFTAKNAKVATQIKQMQLSGLPMRVTYKEYNATLPWRGESKIIVTQVDTVDARTILAPGFRPEYIYNNGNHE